MTTKIKYLVGDATEPIGSGNKLICHCCNDINGWGTGFVLALNRKWKEPEKRYHDWYKKNGNKLHLGTIQAVQVEKDIAVINMIGQKGIMKYMNVNGAPPIRYDAIQLCLEKISKLAKKYNATIHAPRFGAGLAGGDWNKIEKAIIDTLSNNNIEVFIYDLPGVPFIQLTSIENISSDSNGSLDNNAMDDLFEI